VKPSTQVETTLMKPATGEVVHSTTTDLFTVRSVMVAVLICELDRNEKG
jgi:hypothetical protein